MPGWVLPAILLGYTEVLASRPTPTGEAFPSSPFASSVTSTANPGRDSPLLTEQAAPRTEPGERFSRTGLPPSILGPRQTSLSDSGA